MPDTHDPLPVAAEARFWAQPSHEPCRNADHDPDLGVPPADAGYLQIGRGPGSVFVPLCHSCAAAVLHPERQLI